MTQRSNFKKFEDLVKETSSTTEGPAQQQAVSAGVQQGDTLICPKCGGKLVLRTAKKGPNAGNQFYGCSNYPNCRYIIQN